MRQSLRFNNPSVICFVFCLSSVLESWLDYTGELEPPEPLARLPQLKHRMKRLLTQLGKVQQIALYSSTWGHQRTAAAPAHAHGVQEKCSKGSSLVPDCNEKGTSARLGTRTLTFSLLLFLLLERFCVMESDAQAGQCHIQIVIWTLTESGHLHSGLNTKSNLVHAGEKSLGPDYTSVVPMQLQTLWMPFIWATAKVALSLSGHSALHAEALYLKS